MPSAGQQAWSQVSDHHRDPSTYTASMTSRAGSARTNAIRSDRAGSDDSAKVQAALESLRSYPANGIYTTYTFGPNDRNGFEVGDLTIVYAAEEQHGLYRRPNNAP